ncbi:tripartite tricarboxylate transporter TctB family protein [Lentibacillus sediminis]|uniref:tripartite tricarboxylate transporter TctB family protein n=1 Tax=Lentibacillus sediminis TaxID=1940529 RepID=UPI000C1BECFC|nr:tripartite tricarboxylate transporter TctB family protein [Lentibacillus sediminis]
MEIRIPTNLVGGIIMMLLSIIIWFLIPEQIATDPAFQGGIVDSRFVPRILVGIMFILSMFLITLSLIFKKENIVVYDLKNEFRAFGYLGILVLYVLLVNYAGFLIACLLMGIGTLAYMKSKSLKYYMIIIVAFLIIYFVFTNLLAVPLPGMGV